MPPEFWLQREHHRDFYRAYCVSKIKKSRDEAMQR